MAASISRPPTLRTSAVTSRRRPAGDAEESGLGLGFFIAKTLLERAGASLAFLNRQPPAQGAVVHARWARGDFEVSETPQAT